MFGYVALNNISALDDDGKQLCFMAFDILMMNDNVITHSHNKEHNSLKHHTTRNTHTTPLTQYVQYTQYTQYHTIHNYTTQYHNTTHDTNKFLSIKQRFFPSSWQSQSINTLQIFSLCHVLKHVLKHTIMFLINSQHVVNNHYTQYTQCHTTHNTTQYTIHNYTHNTIIRTHNTNTCNTRHTQCTQNPQNTQHLTRTIHIQSHTIQNNTQQYSTLNTLNTHATTPTHTYNQHYILPLGCHRSKPHSPKKTPRTRI